MSDTPTLALKISGKLYPVETYADASEMVEKALASYHGRYSDLPELALVNRKGRKVGHVSTNGRVWLGKSCVWPMADACQQATQPALFAAGAAVSL